MGTSYACIVLAAGASTRFGSDKRQIKNRSGQSLLDVTLNSIPPLFGQHLVVLRPGDESLAAQCNAGWQVIYAKDAAEGMGCSLAAAVTQLQPCAGCLIVLADMPLVARNTYAMLINAATPERIAVPYFAGQRGNPVWLGSAFFARLSTLKGDSGARQLMQQHPDYVLRVDVDDPGILQDVDTPTELLQIPGFGMADQH